MFAACFRISVLGKLRDNCSLTWRKSRYWVLAGWRFLKSHTWRRNSGAQRRDLDNTHWCCTYGICEHRAGFGSTSFQAEFTLETYVSSRGFFLVSICLLRVTLVSWKEIQNEYENTAKAEMKGYYEEDSPLCTLKTATSVPYSIDSML